MEEMFNAFKEYWYYLLMIPIGILGYNFFKWIENKVKK